MNSIILSFSVSECFQCKIETAMIVGFDAVFCANKIDYNVISSATLTLILVHQLYGSLLYTTNFVNAFTPLR